MSKIIKAEKIVNLEILTPKGDIPEEEVFYPLIKNEEPIKEEEENQTYEEEAPNLPSKEVLEEIFQRAYEEGFQRGYEEGFKKAEKEGFEKGLERGLERAKYDLEEEKKRLYQEIESLKEEERKKFEDFLKRLDRELENLILDLDKEILQLSLEIAKKLTLKTIETDKDLLLRILREALKYIAEGTEVIVKVHPDEASNLFERTEEFPKNYRIKIVPDASITKGGLFIETKLGIIDATFEKRFERLLEALESED